MVQDVFREASTCRKYVSRRVWEPVAAVRTPMVYRVYLGERKGNWYVLLAGFLEQELLFMPERCYGPYEDKEDALALVDWLSRPSGAPVPSPALVNALDGYVFMPCDTKSNGQQP